MYIPQGTSRNLHQVTKRNTKVTKEKEVHFGDLISVLRSSVRSHATHAIAELKNYDIYSCTFGPPAAAYVPVLILHLSIVCKVVYLGAVWYGSSVDTVQWCSLGYSVSMLKMNCQKQLFQNINFQQLVKSFGNQRSSFLHRLNVNRSLVSSNKQKSL